MCGSGRGSAAAGAASNSGGAVAKYYAARSGGRYNTMMIAWGLAPLRRFAPQALPASGGALGPPQRSTGPSRSVADAQRCALVAREVLR